MGILTFSVSEISSKLWPEYKLRPKGSESSGSGAVIMLVHNQGVYLMADSKIPESAPEESITYACGCNPAEDAGWQMTSRSLVGGDDFSQQLPPEWFEQAIINGDDTLSLEVDGDSISLVGA